MKHIADIIPYLASHLKHEHVRAYCEHLYCVGNLKPYEIEMQHYIFYYGGLSDKFILVIRPLY